MTIETTDKVTVKLIDHMGSDAGIVAAARVSFKGPEIISYTEDPAENTGLINFLLSKRHGTPFEHNAMTFFISAPVFVFREFHRHRVGWSYNEESARYKKLDPKFYVPNIERPLVQEGKPGHYIFVPGADNQYEEMRRSTELAQRVAYQEYENMLARGIAKEVARGVLPVSIFSSMYATCNARSLMSFLSLRTKREDSMFPSYPQREIEMVADEMEEIFADLFPITAASFDKNGRVSP